MAGITVDTDALDQAATALGTYISEVLESIHKMRDAAVDCSDNMGSDLYSQKAIEKLGICIKDLSQTIQEAQDLRKKILAKKSAVESSYNNF